MSMNVISNYAANVAHRNLMTSDAAATSSLAKLSSGSRVVSAKDDAAAMAIGARLNSTVNALKQASVNAGQGVSMLQIADGAMARVNDVLVRMKTLSVQAGSGQLSATERGMLDTEYQSLVSEVTRIAAATDFNGQQLVNGSLTTVQNASTSAAFAVADGVGSITAHGLTPQTGTGTNATVDMYTLSYSTTGHTFTLSGPSGASYTGSIASSAINSSGGMATGAGVKLSAVGTSPAGDVVISLNTAFAANTTVASGSANGMYFTGSSSTSFSYKVGAGTDATKDVITVSVDGINSANLALAGTDITTAATADAASDLISAAIDTLNTARSKVGAYQNRLEFASANLASAIENSEAARSNLLDLDIAQEMTTFTSKQILTQAGVSMLAQANQMPQNLLKLFQ